MSTNKEVFALRKAGQLDEAYRLALQLNNAPNAGIWDVRALAWCLIDLIKRGPAPDRPQELEQHRQHLQKLPIDARQDELLAKHREDALAMCEPYAPIISQAQANSKQGNFAEAVRCYTTLLPNLPPKYHTSFGWDLYRYSKQLYKEGPHTITKIKRNLQQYLTLEVGKPSQLHSTILWLAKEIAKTDQLDLVAFLRSWGFDAFRGEDFERRPAKDGRQFPALAEDVAQWAIKSAMKSKSREKMEYILPFLENIIGFYPDSQWLTYYKAKALVFLGRAEEAQQYCRSVCKRKPNEFWAWGLLGDAYSSEHQTALVCYAKALLCPAQDVHTINVRIKTAKLLAALGHNEQAKYEVTICQQLKQDNLPQEISQLLSQDWFQSTEAPPSNTDFYSARAAKAEELLLADIPWEDAVMGETFAVSRNDGKATQTRRKIYLRAMPFPREVSYQERMFPYPKLPIGSPIRVKGEDHQGRPYQILAIAQRDRNELWDIFSSHVGIISFVNTSKRIYHLLINRDVEVFFHFDKLDAVAHENDFVEAKIAQFLDAKGKKYNIVEAKKTNQTPCDKIYKHFSNESVTISGEIGFTESNIFIPSNLVKENKLVDCDNISGKSILNYNKKKSTWGWKAITIKK